MKFKITKNKIIAGAIVLVLLIGAFWYGGESPNSQGWEIAPKTEAEELDDEVSEDEEDMTSFKKQDIEKDVEESKDEVGENELEKEEIAEDNVKSKDENPETKAIEDDHDKVAIPKSKSILVESVESETSDIEGSCTLAIRCDTILDNMDWLNPEKIELVPEDGVIFAEKTVTFYPGESVFDVLLREVKNAGIHMEFTDTPMYNSAYINGINNLYEFDCGELSGWTYKVNNWFPNYGSSQYEIKEGDKIEFLYSCDLGKDLEASKNIGGE